MDKLMNIDLMKKPHITNESKVDQPIITNINQLIYRNGTDRRFRQATGPCQSRGQTLHLDKTTSSLRFASHLRSKWLWRGRKNGLNISKYKFASLCIYIYICMNLCIYVYMYKCINV